MEKVQDTYLNIGGLNWPVLINVGLPGDGRFEK